MYLTARSNDSIEQYETLFVMFRTPEIVVGITSQEGGGMMTEEDRNYNPAQNKNSKKIRKISFVLKPWMIESLVSYLLDNTAS